MIRLRLPATSANLGPGFDSLGLAMQIYLDIEAELSISYRIAASGRDATLCGDVDNSLILSTYRGVLKAHGRDTSPISMRLHNEIPLGMGCGSSAAALLAGVLLANHFGDLKMGDQAILEEACQLEGHPDNVAACWLGGMTASAAYGDRVVATSLGEGLDWKLLIALPTSSLATSKARALLPDGYSRADAVFNIQATALLVAAFATGRVELLQAGMQDRIHQPYRLAACPLLGKLLPLSGTDGIRGVALSGAGPSVLLIADAMASSDALRSIVRDAAGDPGLEVVETKLSAGALRLGRA